MSEHVDWVNRRLRETVDIVQAMDDGLKERIVEVARAIEQAHAGGRRVVVFGNGGSAADAQHLAAELVGRFLKERSPMDVLALTTNASTVTCLINDYPPEILFARQVRAHVQAGDVVIGISTSGNSANVVAALEEARRIEARTVGMTGASGGRMAALCDVLLNVPSTSTPRIQEIHVMMIHQICELAEAAVAAVEDAAEDAER